MDDDVLRREMSHLLEMVDDPEAFVAGLHALLRRASDAERQASYQRVVPDMGKSYGTPIPALGIIAAAIGRHGREHPDAVLLLLERLWRNGSFEERIIVGKSLEPIGKVHWEEALRLGVSFVGDVADWAVCDQLGSIGLRPIAIQHPDAILPLCQGWVQDANSWTRRFGVVVLVGMTRDKGYQVSEAELRVLDWVMADPAPAVRKAVAWALREMSKRDPAAVAAYLCRHAEDANRHTRWIVVNGMHKLPAESQRALRGRLGK